MKKDISIILITLVIITFFLRIGSIKKEHPLTYDEIVYPALAAQKSENPANYNTIGIYNKALQEGQKLPEYFKNPLFKHPPLFPDLIRVSYALFGRTYLSAGKVSLLFGVLLIALAYFLGLTMFNSKVGVYAALLMSIEPISWISSQKIWMETTLAFFTVLAFYLFILAVKKYNPWIMIGSGVSAGLAVLTKYPGLLATGIILLYALCAERWLFKKKAFIFSLFIPFIMFIPWIQWNYRVYGVSMLGQNDEILRLMKLLRIYTQRLWPVLLTIILAFISKKIIQKKWSMFYEKYVVTKKDLLLKICCLFFICSVFFMLRFQIKNALNFYHIPEAGWKLRMFQGYPRHFYLGKILELSPFYLFSYLAVGVLAFDAKNRKKYFFLFFSSAIILLFYTLWGNFQCRYIGAAVVFLIVLSARAQLYILSKLKEIRHEYIRIIFMSVLLITVLYFAAKTLRVDFILAVPNSSCYF